MAILMNAEYQVVRDALLKRQMIEANFTRLGVKRL
jgi:hypothetical protein